MSINLFIALETLGNVSKMPNIDRSIEYKAKILRALADPVRLKIIDFLKGGEQCVCKIQPAVGKRQSTVSKHLSILYDSGILDRRVEGKWTYYRIKNPRIFSLLQELDGIVLDSASDLIATVRSLKTPTPRAKSR
jgi:DNA-binding transcriptional ArsR family regulator